MPGPRRQRGPGAVAQNAACEGCHEDVAREWRGSLHQRANIEPAYQRALAIEPMRFCQGCHAPESPLDADVPDDIGAFGVGCVTCQGGGAASYRPDMSGHVRTRVCASSDHEPTRREQARTISRVFGHPAALYVDGTAPAMRAITATHSDSGAKSTSHGGSEP